MPSDRHHTSLQARQRMRSRLPHRPPPMPVRRRRFRDRMRPLHLVGFLHPSSTTAGRVQHVPPVDVPQRCLANTTLRSACAFPIVPSLSGTRTSSSECRRFSSPGRRRMDSLGLEPGRQPNRQMRQRVLQLAAGYIDASHGSFRRLRRTFGILLSSGWPCPTCKP